MRRLVPLTLSLVLATAVVAWAEVYQTMPESLAAKWLSATTAREGWNRTGYDSAGWVPVTCDIAAGYPLWMSPAQQALHRFMWHPGGANRGRPTYFRRPLWVDGQVTAATFRLCADDQFRFFVNGYPAGGRRSAGVTGAYEVTTWLKRGNNVLGVEAMDVKPPGWGLLVVGEVTQTWPFDPKRPQWRCSATAASGWNRPEFDDARWKPAARDAAPAIAVREAGTFACFALPGGTIPEYSSAYFRLPLALDGLPRRGALTILADDGYELYVNGKLMAIERRVDRAYRPVIVDIGQALRPGHNVIAVRVTNTWGPGRLYCVPTVTVVL
jgi:hypothetical protein